MRKVKFKWNTKRWGVQLQTYNAERLTNLRFADDILLLPTPRQRITNMLSALSVEAGKLGLQLHPDKNQTNTQRTYRSPIYTQAHDGE